MIDFTEISDGDTWELFSRDFFSALGFVIEIDPSRGADAGKDFVISEQVSGRLHTKKFTWLVSCKHNATSGKAVGLNDEANIRERLEQHNCDGFIGFYSTLASTALVERLEKARQYQHIQNYAIYDGQKISGYFFDVGFSRIASRYFPQSYNKSRPIQKLIDKHVELKCEICGCDWVKEIALRPEMGIVLQTLPMNKDDNKEIEDVFVVCKGNCDRQLEKALQKKGFITQWEDIGDLCNPLGFLKNCLTYMNILYSGRYKYSEKAHEKQKEVFIAVAQKVLREITDEEKKRVAKLSMLEGL